MSFDIECDSSHGDFPLAVKNYKKLAAELLDNVNNQFKRITDKEGVRELLSNETKQKEIIKRLIQLSFIEKPNNEEISYCYTKKNKKPSEKDIDACVSRVYNILYIRLQREQNYKELRQAVDHTKSMGKSVDRYVV